MWFTTPFFVVASFLRFAMAEVAAKFSMPSPSRARSADQPKIINQSNVSDSLGRQLYPLITRFLQEVQYKPPEIKANKALWDAMLQKALRTEIPIDNAHTRMCFEVGFTYAAVVFPRQSPSPAHSRCLTCDRFASQASPLAPRFMPVFTRGLVLRLMMPY